ncbi:Uncharacterized UPF0118 membrane protein [hydrothermal vent metagenome]|uniref:Uncharacterized UPF0118 membrane protein n=1 Tax=hydrothermal vent metagenome TaxID=652676 RepID=A0A3B0YWJ1_9ZZZZ
MSTNHFYSPGARFLFIAAAFVIVVAGLKTAEAIIVPFLLSLFVAVISTPFLFWLQQRRIPDALALLIVMLTVLAVITLIAVFIGGSLNDFSKELPVYQARLQEDLNATLIWFNSHGIALPIDKIKASFDPGMIMGLVGTLFASLSSVLTNAFFILLTASFILLEASTFPQKIRSILDNPEASIGYFSTLTDNVKRYVAMKTAVSLLTGTVIAIWLAIIGVDYPLLWGLLAFLFNYVPNIGSIIAAVPAVFLALVQSGATLALGAAAGYIAVNVIIGNIIEPRLMGKTLGLSTLVVFLSLVFWGWVLGPTGMLLSVPLTMVIKIALESHDKTHWLAIMLGSEHELHSDTKTTLESTKET